MRQIMPHKPSCSDHPYCIVLKYKMSDYRDIIANFKAFEKLMTIVKSTVLILLPVYACVYAMSEAI